jgi:hypothetical protein
MVSGVAMAKNDASVKINADVFRKLRTLASWKGIHVSDLLTEIASAYVDKELAAMARELTTDAAKEDEAEEQPKRRKPKGE